MVFQVMALGSTVEEVSLLVNSLSKYLETEWEMASLEVSNGALEITRSGPREDRFLFSLRASFLILLLLKTIPSPPDFVRNLASACGGAQGGAAWILCTMVNSYCDRIRAIGVRCFVAYLELTGRHPDQPINLEDSQVPDLEKVKSYENRSLQENTMSLISNVGHGLMNSNVGKGLAAIGPSIGLKSQTSSKLTPRVAYKLLWHLLKSHRYRIDKWTQGSLVAMVYERKQHSSLFALSNLKEKFLAPDDFFKDSLRIDWTLVESTMHDFSVPLDASIRGDLGLSTIMRLLRFLPDDYLDQWLSYFVNISARNTDMLDCLSTTQDWQPCLFQLSSELTERLVVSTTKQSEQEFTEHSPHHVVVCGGDRLGAGDKTPENEAIFVRLNLALELHSILLGNLFRHGEARALGAIEDAASLQRVYLNGQKVLLLILTKLFSNLASFGVLPVEKITATTTPSENYAASIMLKQSAKLITDTILSNTSKGMSMPAAVDSWRCVRHLIALVVAMVTRLGYVLSRCEQSRFWLSRLTVCFDRSPQIWCSRTS